MSARDPRLRKLSDYTYVDVGERWTFDQGGDNRWRVYDEEAPAGRKRIGKANGYRTLDEAVVATLGKLP